MTSLIELPLAPPVDPDRRRQDAVGLRFIACDAGWVEFTIDTLVVPPNQISATHIDDPFRAMLSWLETISDGADVASWAIAEEGSSARLIYSADHSGCLGGGKDRLIYIGDSKRQIFGFAAVVVERTALVREFYYAFRNFADTLYDPAHWESAMPFGTEYRDLTEEEEDALPYRWDGFPLRLLRSAKLETYLDEAAPEQMTFDRLWRC